MSDTSQEEDKPITVPNVVYIFSKYLQCGALVFNEIMQWAKIKLKI